MPPKRDSKTGRYTAVFGQPSPLGHGTAGRFPSITPTIPKKKKKSNLPFGGNTLLATTYPKHNQPVFGQPSTLNHNNNVFGVGASVKAKTSTSGFETLAHTSGGPVFKPPPSDFVGGVHKKRKAIFLLKNCKRNFK
jgi:hypothetical protein